MRYLKKFEGFNINTPINELVSKLDNIVDYSYKNDDEVTLKIKSGSDKSNNCPDILEFDVKFIGMENQMDENFKSIEVPTFSVLRVNDNYKIGEYMLNEAVPAIMYSYRDL
jgi:hypothetical protein